MSQPSVVCRSWRSFYGSNWFIFALFLFLSYLFYGAGVDLFSAALTLGDGFLEGMPFKTFYASFSLWNPFLQSGTYAVKEPSHQVLYFPATIIMNIFPPIVGYNVLLLLHYAFAGFFLFLFLRTLQLKRTASFIGGLCFMFSGFLAAHKVHYTYPHTAAWLPLILYFVERYFEDRRDLYLFFSAIAFSLCVLANSFNIVVYTGMIVFLYLIFRIWSDEHNKTASWTRNLSLMARCNLAVFLIGLLLASIQLLPIIESLKYITREKISYDFFSAFSFPFSALVLLFFPNLFGSSASTLYTVNYYGPWNLSEMSGYMGILPLTFAFTSFILWRKGNKQIWFWSLVALSCFVLALGSSTPLYKLMYHVPIYNMFRVPARNWFEVNFAAAILCAFSVHFFISQDTLSSIAFKKLRNTIFCLITVTLAILGCVSAIHVIPSFFPLSTSSTLHFFQGNGYSSSQVMELFLRNTAASSPALYIPLLAISLSLIFLILLNKFRTTRGFWLAVTGLIFLDLFSFGHFLNNVYPDYSFLAQKNKVASYAFLKSSDGNLNAFRALALDDYNYDEFAPNINLFFGIQVPNAYGPSWLKDYAKMTAFLSSGHCNRQDFLIRNSSLFSILATKYFLTQDPKMKEYIESITGTVRNGASETILEGGALSGWQFWQPFSQDGNTVTLKSRDETGTQSSLMQYPVEVSGNGRYRITFEARSPLPSDELVLAVDFAGFPHYDLYSSPSTLAFYISPDVSTDFRPIIVSFATPPDIPRKVYLRLYTFKPVPIEIRNVRLERIYPVTYWGPREEARTEYHKYRKKYEANNGIAIFENMNFLPRARFVTKIRTVRDFDEANHILWNDIAFSPSTTALVEGYDGDKLFPGGEVSNADYSKRDSIRLSVNTEDRGFLVLSDTWYPGWKAYVDRQETPVYKTNGVLRGILIEGKGEHMVDFVFRPRSFYVGLFISMATLSMIVSFIAYDLLRRGRRKQDCSARTPFK